MMAKAAKKRASKRAAPRSSVVSDYLATAQPQHKNRSKLQREEPETVAACLQWIEWTIAGKTQVSFAQFYRDVLKKRLGTTYTCGAVQNYLRTRHGPSWQKATRGA